MLIRHICNKKILVCFVIATLFNLPHQKRNIIVEQNRVFCNSWWKYVHAKVCQLHILEVDGGR